MCDTHWFGGRTGELHTQTPRGAPIGVIAVVLVMSPAAPAAAPAAALREMQSAFMTSDDKAVSSSELVKMINQKLGGNYRNIEIVVTSCFAGEFVTRAAGKGGLKGSWSVATASSSDKCAEVQIADTKFELKGQDGTDVLSLAGSKAFYHGYTPQYLGKLKEDGNTTGAKPLHDFARNKSSIDNKPQYGSSGASADGMTVHGAPANRAIILGSKADEETELGDFANIAYDGLRGAGYAAEEIRLLFGDSAPKGNIRGPAHKAELEKALQLIRPEVADTPDTIQVYLLVLGHGSYMERTVAYNDGQLNQQGGGLAISNANPGLLAFADDPGLQQLLLEELPRSGGGLWADDPGLQRMGSPYIAFSTLSETFSGPALAGVYLNGLFAGEVAMGNSLGAQYHLDLSDTVLDAIMGDILATGRLDVRFALPSGADSFQFAGFEDWLNLDDRAMDYGFSIGAVIASNAVVTVPLPGTAVLLSVALALCLVGPCHGHSLRRRPDPCRSARRANHHQPERAIT